MLTNNAVTQSRMDRLSQLMRAMDRINSDFSQAMARASRMDGITGRQVFRVGTTWLESDDDAVMFIRAGWLNSAARLRRSELQRVGYRLSQGRLERVSWLYPDVAQGANPTVAVLFDGIRGFKLRFYYQGQWVADWQITREIPQAVEVTLELEDYGQIQRRFLLASALENG
ncbi:PilD-dependent protein pddD [Campylobacter jejuni]|nr:PilD-dependent protein pddD [Campylobacter jejuni]